MFQWAICRTRSMARKSPYSSSFEHNSIQFKIQLVQWNKAQSVGLFRSDVYKWVDVDWERHTSSRQQISSGPSSFPPFSDIWHGDLTDTDVDDVSVSRPCAAVAFYLFPLCIAFNEGISQTHFHAQTTTEGGLRSLRSSHRHIPHISCCQLHTLPPPFSDSSSTNTCASLQ